MYKKLEKDQIRFEEFKLSFGGKLDGKNRWIRLASIIPWSDLELTYAQKMNKNNGRRAYSFRVAFGSQIIKAKLNLRDRETVEQLKENPYLQYFIGMDSFSHEAPFDHSMMSEFRKRLSLDDMNKINDILSDYQNKNTGKSKRSNDDKEIKNKGRLKIDASVAPEDICYPSDVNLLNKSREKTEKMIDMMSNYLGVKKPRTYKRVARKIFLNFCKNKKPARKVIRKATRKQLEYLKRNLKYIEEMVGKGGLHALSRKSLKDLMVINEIYRQQFWMYSNKQNKIADRIVSIHKPHVRPIVRGKMGKKTEFGAKISISVCDGISYLDRLSWDAYNEGGDLQEQVENYKRRYGYFPECVCADKIYANRENRRFLQERGIRLTAKALGRPKETIGELSSWEKRRAKAERNARNAVEGVFGVGKRRYSLDRIMTKLSGNSEMWIATLFVVMNLEAWLKEAIKKYFAWRFVDWKLNLLKYRVLGLGRFKLNNRLLEC